MGGVKTVVDWLLQGEHRVEEQSGYRWVAGIGWEGQPGQQSSSEEGRGSKSGLKVVR